MNVGLFLGLLARLCSQEDTKCLPMLNGRGHLFVSGQYSNYFWNWCLVQKYFSDNNEKYIFFLDVLYTHFPAIL
jgi:hypothetical protein